MIEDIPGHRLQAPDTATWGEAGMLARELFRLSGAAKGAGHERKFLNDALIYLLARGIGASVVTGNVADFDFPELTDGQGSDHSLPAGMNQWILLKRVNWSYQRHRALLEGRTVMVSSATEP